ncbi:type VI secretion system tip protein TssI/VgrG [Neptunomonas phycophila]|uniref:type VI secretion system Vgr family protein n=2 Tax=Neptunomonas phycophila TaxID=1572645 RepID=UPI0015BF10A0|nr:type VI secretion system tip protein VgrG [Neptunomonas phycophila]MDO6782850.1 type VI secretion system tip protein TssI/VgrG [Neptunomonas phycophila]QLE97109.1 type VI secretion system tip protein VgrG [Neptunomonas phycophila]
MADFKQQSRLLAIDTPLGDDVFLLTRLAGEESVSALFGIEIEAYSLRKDITPAEIVGQNVTLKIAATDESALFLPDSYRYINGYIKSFRQEGRQLQDLRGYSAVVVPWLWFLTQTSDCKIFQFKNIQEIATAIFEENGFTDFQFRLVGQHPARDYCVQYKESDFNFISRLFEEEGLYYYFAHEAGKHTLIISDHIGGYDESDEQSITYAAGSLTQHTIHNWYHSFQFMTGRYAKRDYDFKKPSNRLQTSAAADMVVPGVGKYEHFIYPGRYEDKTHGDQLTRLRVEADEAAHDVITGEGGCRSFSAGHTFVLERHDDAPEELGEYVLLSVSHKAQDYSYTSNDEQDKEYSNEFRCISSETIYRPPQTTGWPRMQGPQNAIVVGPEGEEIYTDEYGRVKVQFPWDRYGAYNENSSCWVRVTHSWAGKNWGNIYLPRIGQEVIVDFMDGDPDRPIITGRVYNAEQMPPYELPANKTQSGTLTRSTKGGTASNANALRFEDKKGEEEVWLHAEKDQRIEVENDESHWVGHDRVKEIDHDETVFVHHDRTETVDNNEKILIRNNRMHTTGIAEIKTVGMVRVHTVGVNETNTIGAAQENTVGVARTSTIGESDTLNVGKSLKINVGETIEIACGKSLIKLDSEGNIFINGVKLSITGEKHVQIEGKRVDIN